MAYQYSVTTTPNKMSETTNYLLQSDGHASNKTICFGKTSVLSSITMLVPAGDIKLLPTHGLALALKQEKLSVVLCT